MRGYRTDIIINNGGGSDPNKKYLYNFGDSYEQLTGGYVGRRYGQYTGGDRCTPMVSAQPQRLDVYQGSVQYTDYGAYVGGTQSLVNLDGYNTLHMLYVFGNGSEQELVLDISTLKTSYYVGFCYNYHHTGSNCLIALLVSTTTSGGYGNKNVSHNVGYSWNSHLYIYKIWLEK